MQHQHLRLARLAPTAGPAARAVVVAVVVRLGFASELDRVLARLATRRTLLVLDNDDFRVVPRESGPDGCIVACVGCYCRCSSR